MADMQYFDVIIIGAGPAGIFTALKLLEISEQSHDGGTDPIKIAILEKGKTIDKRKCYRSEKGCRNCKTCSIMSGWGGSGAFSDGKLTLSSEIGGWLEEYVGKKHLDHLLDEVAKRYIEFGAKKKRIVDPDNNLASISDFKRKALVKGMFLYPFRILHIGSDGSKTVLKAIYDFLISKGVDIFFNTVVEDFLITDKLEINGVITSNGKKYLSDFVVAATGREGADWLRTRAEKLGLVLISNPVDIGVRVEIPAEISKPLTDILYEFKCKFYSPTFDQLVRTFCVCPNGEVTMENTPAGNGDRIITVNGHSYAEKQTECTNFAILVTTEFTEPFKNPTEFGMSISKLANLLSDNSVIVQRLVDLKKGRRSTPSRMRRSILSPTLKAAIPGDLSFVLPYRHLKSILEFIEALDSIIPGVNSNNTILYGVEAKFYSNRFQLNNSLETDIEGLFAIGDGAGVTRSLSQASASGLIVAEEIARRMRLKQHESQR